MRWFFIALLAMIILLAGCISPKTEEKPIVPARSSTCEEFCIVQPHTQCSGSWKISGTYPACSCIFDCIALDVPLNNSNSTPLATGNKSSATTAPIVSIPLTQVFDTRSSEVIFNDEITKIRDNFYRSHSDGTYKETKRVMMLDESTSTDPREIGFDGSSVMPQINSKPIEGIRAIGHYNFTNQNTRLTYVAGIALIDGNRSEFDDLGPQEAFSIQYPDIILESCVVDLKNYFPYSAGKRKVSYQFICQKITRK